MNANDICPPVNADGHRGCGPFHAFIRRQVKGVANKGLPGRAQENGISQPTDLIKTVEEF
jgi:hypothetical protein